MLSVDITKQVSRGPAPFRLTARFTLPEDCRNAVFFGPSGSGKTVTMQCIAGLMMPDNGRIAVGETVFFDSREGVRLPARKRRLGYVPQDYALFPHLTVLQNVAYAHTGPFARHVGRREREEAREMLGRFRIGNLAGRYPHELSGGQRQRAALARALNAAPRLLLMDEPFSALDVPLREALRAEIRELLAQLVIPSIIITHDPADVEAFGGARVVFAGGRASLAADAGDE
ncbi:MAG: ATP-binding cassette domain-containing protein [Desulfovibrio sp.]|uniref:ATP-binding cassette domain-containing protein n=1 Tax=Desulfovibrio sp. TaxID=885 RepID=UPI001A750055|nr:ATP-binding cassette domain-containing protein [Desulfovibrio sp.]MBD5417239.1 ATP-binding cassette domain-containing protein [Desulfovibrio sp.]